MNCFNKKHDRTGQAFVPIALLLLVLVTVFLAGCRQDQAENAPAASDGASPRRKLIIDSDAGADDASAIILAAGREDIEILGVTVLAGNVVLEQGANNILMTLEMAGQDVPVYKGASKNSSGQIIETYSVFGNDGMGDADLIHPKGRAEEGDAVTFILETVRKYPNEVEIVALGPATNIAEAIEQDPETMKNVKKIWSMGTTGLGPGNASPVAEFNVYKDPDAYKIMLDSEINTTIVGLDICGREAHWTDEQFEKLEKTNDIGRFVTASFGKIREFYAKNGSAGSVMNADVIAMTCVLYPDFIKDSVNCHTSCITDPGETYGQVIFYREGFNYDAVANDFDFNDTLITDVNEESVFDIYLSAIR